MDSRTGFRRINGAEEDGRDNSGGDRLGLGFSKVPNCGTVIWRIWRTLRHWCSRMMAERCFSTHGQVGLWWLHSAFTQIMLFSGGVRPLGTSRTSSAHALFLFGDGRGLWRWYSSTVSGIQRRGRDITAASFSSNNGDGISWFSTNPVRTSNLLCLFTLQMSLKIYRISLYGEVLRCVELWRTFISRGNET